MADFSHKGLNLRWTNALEQIPGQAQRVLVEGGPVSPANVLRVIYSVDGGPERMTRGWPVGSDPETGMQAFCADLPAVAQGQVLHWRPVLSQGGREADPGREAMVPEAEPPAPAPNLPKMPTPDSLARLQPPTQGFHHQNENPQAELIPLPNTDDPRVAAAQQDTSKPFFPFHCEYLFRIFAPFDRKSFNVGITPDGIPMRFRVKAGGVVRGPAMNADIVEAGGDWMRIRPDGIGMVDVHALMRPETGGMLLNIYTGIADFGKGNYENLAKGIWPELVPVRMVPRYLTSDAQWLWMNRIQCTSIGEVNIPENMIIYDEYAMRGNDGRAT